MSTREHRGFAAALVLLALVFGMSGLSLASLARPRESPMVPDFAAARARAIRGGGPVTVTSDSDIVEFLPDGRAPGQPGENPANVTKQLVMAPATPPGRTTRGRGGLMPTWSRA